MSENNIYAVDIYGRPLIYVQAPTAAKAKRVALSTVTTAKLNGAAILGLFKHGCEVIDSETGKPVEFDDRPAADQGDLLPDSAE